MATPEQPSPPALAEKIVISLRAVGDAPQLKHKRFAVEGDRTISWVVKWLEKNLKCGEGETLFVYVHQTFAPSLDTDIETLYKMYGNSDKLTLTYCKTPAWG